MLQIKNLYDIFKIYGRTKYSISIIFADIVIITEIKKFYRFVEVFD